MPALRAKLARVRIARRAKPRQHEAELQRQAAAILDRLALTWCHPPNGGARSARTGAELKRQGVKRGVPDVLVFDRPPLSPASCGLAIELKTSGGRVTPEQASWHEALRSHGWIVAVVRSIDELLAALRDAGYI